MISETAYNIGTFLVLLPVVGMFLLACIQDAINGGGK